MAPAALRSPACSASPPASTGPSGNTTRANYATQYNNILTQIDQLAADAGFNGVNLLTGGTLSATFNGTGSSSYSVSGVSATSSGLGLSSAANTWQTDANINSAVSQLSTALTSLTNMANSFSTADTVLSVRKDFTNSMVGFLNTASDNLTANNPNEDGAALLALQTRQQIAASALTFTTNADANVLRLFGLSGN